jgi:hypothetical protein
VFGTPKLQVQPAAATGGRRRLQTQLPHAAQGPHAAVNASQRSGGSSRDGGQPFVFLSSFKWEARKGYDILLEVGGRDLAHTALNNDEQAKGGLARLLHGSAAG